MYICIFHIQYVDSFLEIELNVHGKWMRAELIGFLNSAIKVAWLKFAGTCVCVCVCVY